MRLAYADPPYLGCCALYEHHHGDDGRCWDDLATHAALIDRLTADYPDGWAMSATSTSLQRILPLCPPGVRVAAWTKPFAAFKRNVRVAYTWEPVILYGGRVSSADGAPPCRDHVAVPITMRRGFTGAKPEAFCRWVMDMLGCIDGDQIDDLFPGTGVFGRVADLPVLALDYEQGSLV
jgi:hypothetical protein